MSNCRSSHCFLSERGNGLARRQPEQKLIDLLDPERLREEKALPELTPDGPKTVHLVFLLDALGDGLKVQRVSELDDGLGKHAAVCGLPDIVNEGLVDLQDVDREPLQVAERGIAGT